MSGTRVASSESTGAFSPIHALTYDARVKLIGLVGTPHVLFSATRAKALSKGLGDKLDALGERLGDNICIMYLDAALPADKDTIVLALGASFGIVGWLPFKKAGGTLVCWKEGSLPRHARLADTKLRALVPDKTKSIGKLAIDGPQILACNDYAPQDKTRTWIDVPLAAGQYNVGLAKPKRTELGTLAFVTLTPT